MILQRGRLGQSLFIGRKLILGRRGVLSASHSTIASKVLLPARCRDLVRRVTFFRSRFFLIGLFLPGRRRIFLLLIICVLGLTLLGFSRYLIEQRVFH